MDLANLENLLLLKIFQFMVFVNAQNVTYFVAHDVNGYMIKRLSNLSLYLPDSDFSSSCIDKSQPKNTHISLNM